MAQTVAEIKQALDDLGVGYQASAKKADLEALLAEHSPPEPEDTTDVLKATPENAHEYVTCPACSHSAPSAEFARSYV